MKRRDFLKATTASAFAVVGAAGFLSWTPRLHAANLTVNLGVAAGNVGMIDGTQAYMLTYTANGTPGFPGPTIVCQEGDTITLNLVNPLNTPVAVTIGRTGIRTVAPAKGNTSIVFDAPAAGSYLYYDDQNNGVNRILGLHGSLIVMPAGTKNRSFASGPDFVRQYQWILGSIDTAWGELVRTNGHGYVSSIDPDSYSPRYFTINGKSYAATHEDNTEIMGLIGDAILIRLMNAGGVVNSPHFHGTHVEILSVNGENYGDSRKLKDVVSMFPLDARDVLLPMKSPPDAWPPAQGPQHFPMHCHTEMSQTAGGGLYPHGMHAAIVIGQAPHHESDLHQAVQALS